VIVICYLIYVSLFESSHHYTYLLLSLPILLPHSTLQSPSLSFCIPVRLHPSLSLPNLLFHVLISLRPYPEFRAGQERDCNEDSCWSSESALKVHPPSPSHSLKPIVYLSSPSLPSPFPHSSFFTPLSTLSTLLSTG
jgi:hypothetical protein